MTKIVSDEVAIVFFQQVIIPWEISLSKMTGVWDIKRTRQKLEQRSITLVCVPAGQVSVKAEDLRKLKNTNFLVWESADSQAKDLFRHLRNCAAHASFETINSKRQPPVLRFQALKRDRTSLIMSGDVEARNLTHIASSLVSL